MGDQRVAKQIDIRARSERELDLRIDFFMRAVHRRSGEVLDIEWLDETGGPPHAAILRFRLPAPGAADEE